MIKDFSKFVGENKGSTSIILAGIHGNEKCGIEALEELIPLPKIERGRVIVGYGNLLAIKKNRRFVDVDLNRMFKSKEIISKYKKGNYEHERAKIIKKYLDTSDVLLDIHASSTIGSKPFVICEKNAFEIAKSLPVDIVVSGFDKVQPGGTDYYMNSIGKIGICIECGYLKSKKSKLIAKKSIMNFLISRKHIKGNIKKQKQLFIKIYSQYITKTSTFILSKKFKDFEKILKNQTIGLDGNKEIKASRNSVILFAKNRNCVGDEAFLLGEYRKRV